MEVTVAEVAKLVAGTIIGDDNLVLTGISSLDEAGPGDISFLANPKYAPLLTQTRAGAVLVAKREEEAGELVQIVVANPDHAFAQVVGAYFDGPRVLPLPRGVHPTAIIGEGVQLGENIAIGAYSVIGDGVVIGDGTEIYPHVFIGNEAKLARDCVIFPHVTIREACELGERVIIHSGAVIGSDGFGYATVEGVHHKIPQVGIVVLADDVEIGANTTIDRARFGKTVIGRGTKVDNLVQVAHNVQFGERCFVCAQVGVAGSTTFGNYVTIAGQCGIAGHITVGDQVVVAGRSGVSKSVPPKTMVQGMPAQELRLNQAKDIALRRLPKTQATVKQLEQRVAELEALVAKLTGDAQ